MKSKNRRSKAKFPALRKELNVKTRADYIEPDYIDGVYNKDGKCVIRPLTEEEKEWLNKFYEESIITSFKKDGTDFLDSVEDRRKAYRENNYRNACIMNVKKATGQLDAFDETAFDKISYDRFSHLDVEVALINEVIKYEEDEED